MSNAARPHGRPIVEMARILVEAGATELSACRAVIVIAGGGSYADASAELVLADGADKDSDQGEVFHPEMLISRDYGGGGNRTRVTCLPEIPLSSENALGSSDDEPSPPLVAPPLRSSLTVELASAMWGTEA